MTRLVVVSNRVAPIEEGQAATGGLAVGILAALRSRGGVWFGWNGEVGPAASTEVEQRKAGKITFATVGLSRRDYQEYYKGFANGVLWPLFHYRVDLANFKRREFAGYLRVNQRLARHLVPLLRPDDTIWVHDYHLIPFAEELHRAGATQPIGFFLHTPLPAPQVMLALPSHRRLMRALCDYDLVGFQTADDLAAFHDYLAMEAGGTVGADGLVRAFDRTLATGVFPIGIDTREVAATAARFDGTDPAERLLRTIGRRQLIVGVDRLDYSKGLYERFLAFERLLDRYPEEHRGVMLMQVAPPTRGDVQGYVEIRRELEAAAGHINGKFADFDWVPIRYLNKSFEHDLLTGFFRYARVGLVTPLRDGMNLVAKEYVASQDERDPGVLVLSRFAGAARELDQALIVNPHDVDEIVNALRRGLTMPLEERAARWRAMMTHVERHDVHAWRNAFLDALARVAREKKAA